MPAIVPLVSILVSFYLQDWYWGLMDDVQLLESGTNISERFVNYLAVLIGVGHFNPTSAMRSAVIYTWFEHAPVLVHVAKWVEACLMLLAWGIAATRVSGKISALPIFISIALSFHYLYDTFFFLSTHEVIGLLFLGVALNGFLASVETVNRGTLYAFLALSICCLLIGLGAKEPMVSSGTALGISFLVLGVANKSIRSRALFVSAIVLLLSVGYAFSLIIWVQSNYTSSYSFSNIPRMLSSFSSWIGKDLLNHSPWIIIALLLVLPTSNQYLRTQARPVFTQKQLWGILTGLLLYSGYLLILLPWNTISYYAGPLGVFFAFPMAIFIAQVLPLSGSIIQIVAPIFALLFNMLVSHWALTRESLYHYDTQNLMSWIEGNLSFQNDARRKLVDCNAMEAAVAITAHLGRDFALDLPGFIHRGPNNYPPGRILVYTVRFGSPSDVFPVEEWTTLFYSKYWQVYLKQ
jgi:hypothetical protein